MCLSTLILTLTHACPLHSSLLLPCAGPHSQCCRLSIQKTSKENGETEETVSLFLKRCIVRDLIAAHPRADKKIARDAASYNNEAVFYRDFANGVVSLADNFSCCRSCFQPD